LVLESVLRNCDGKRVSEQNVRALANWKPKASRTEEVPFVVARNCPAGFHGSSVAGRSGGHALGRSPVSARIQSSSNRWFQSIWWWTTRFRWTLRARRKPCRRNLDMEFQRNRERYQFLKWGMQAFDTFKVVPPGIGIVHQVNLEYLAKAFCLRRQLPHLPLAPYTIQTLWLAPTRTPQ
jgi:aconitate hydratase